MIITCPNCNKKFKIDNSLIPDEGRDLQCGSCNHVWLYKIEEENSKILELKEEIDSNDIETKVDKNNKKMAYLVLCCDPSRFWGSCRNLMLTIVPFVRKPSL